MSSQDPQSELDAIRAQAAALGLYDDDSDLDVEPVDDFIARMKQSDRGHGTRRALTWTGSIIAAATVASAIVVFRPWGSPAAAEPPPILDFEFAAAVRIAHAGGQDPRADLGRVADAARAATTDAGDGDVQHHVHDSWYSEIDEKGSSVITPRITETWLRPDGSQTSRDSKAPPLSSDGRGIATRAPSPSPDAEVSQLPADSIDAGFAAGLPDDPDGLRKALLDHIDCPDREVGSERSLCLYSEIVALYGTYVVRDETSAALWTMLADEAGFTSLGSVEDRAGREGLGISLIPASRPQHRLILIISTDDGQLLGHEDILIKDQPGLDIEAPSVLSFDTIVTAEHTRSSGPSDS